MTASTRYAARVAFRFCVQCAAGLQDGDGVRCVECAQKQCDDPGKLERDRRHRATPHRKASRVAWMSARYVEAVQAGTCADCGEPSKRFRRCAPCRVRRAAYNANYRGRKAAARAA
jgi:hypothetical protein